MLWVGVEIQTSDILHASTADLSPADKSTNNEGALAQTLASKDRGTIYTAAQFTPRNLLLIGGYSGPLC